MNHQNLLKENRDLKKQNKELQAKLREYDLVADRKEGQDPRSNAVAISDGESLEFLGNMSKEALEQTVKGFEQNYDEDSIKNLHGNEKEEYHWHKIQYELAKHLLETKHGK